MLTLTGAVSFSFLLEFVDALKDEKFPLTTAAVVTDFILPKTEAKKCCYSALLPRHCVSDQPTYFVSHAWDALFIDMVASLQAKIEDPRDTYLWIDIFSVNQHEPFNLKTIHLNLTNSRKGTIVCFDSTGQIFSRYGYLTQILNY